MDVYRISGKVCLGYALMAMSKDGRIQEDVVWDTINKMSEIVRNTFPYEAERAFEIEAASRAIRVNVKKPDKKGRDPALDLMASMLGIHRKSKEDDSSLRERCRLVLFGE